MKLGSGGVVVIEEWVGVVAFEDQAVVLSL